MITRISEYFWCPLYGLVFISLAYRITDMIIFVWVLLSHIFNIHEELYRIPCFYSIIRETWLVRIDVLQDLSNLTSHDFKINID
jgi:hypothetical protein